VELFYTIADPDCAAARKAALARKLDVRFRNMYYPEVQHDFKQRGGRALPALWDGETLHQGLTAVLAVIEAPRAR
jgi:hypothetical protein